MLEKKHITGIILAGGKSSRMGTDKALFVLNGSTFLDHIIRALEPLVDDILIISNDERHSTYNLKRVKGYHCGCSEVQFQGFMPALQIRLLKTIWF